MYISFHKLLLHIPQKSYIYYTITDSSLQHHFSSCFNMFFDVIFDFVQIMILDFVLNKKQLKHTIIAFELCITINRINQLCMLYLAFHLFCHPFQALYQFSADYRTFFEHFWQIVEPKNIRNVQTLNFSYVFNHIYFLLHSKFTTRCV